MTNALTSPPRFRTLCAAVPLVITLALNGLIFATGWNMSDPAYARLSIMPPGWVVGLIWCIIYPLWGLAYAEAAERPSPTAYWVIALMVWGWMYPLLSPLWSTGGSAVANLFSLLLAAVTAWQVSTVSRKGMAFMLPSLVWLSFATWLGYLAWQQAG